MIPEIVILNVEQNGQSVVLAVLGALLDQVVVLLRLRDVLGHLVEENLRNEEAADAVVGPDGHRADLEEDAMRNAKCEMRRRNAKCDAALSCLMLIGEKIPFHIYQ